MTILTIVCTTYGIGHTKPLTAENYTEIPKEIYYKFIKNQNRRIPNWKMRQVYTAVKYYNPRYFGPTDEGIIWILSLMAQESSFRNVNGDEGVSIGYMQIQIPTCEMSRKHNGIKKEMNLHSLWDNIHCSMGELNRLYDIFGNFKHSIMAYNCGASCVKKWIEWDIIEEKEKDYFDKVNKKRKKILNFIDEYYDRK